MRRRRGGRRPGASRQGDAPGAWDERTTYAVSRLGDGGTVRLVAVRR